MHSDSIRPGSRPAIARKQARMHRDMIEKKMKQGVWREVKGNKKANQGLSSSTFPAKSNGSRNRTACITIWLEMELSVYTVQTQYREDKSDAAATLNLVTSPNLSCIELFPRPMQVPRTGPLPAVKYASLPLQGSHIQSGMENHERIVCEPWRGKHNLR